MWSDSHMLGNQGMNMHACNHACNHACRAHHPGGRPTRPENFQRLAKSAPNSPVKSSKKAPPYVTPHNLTDSFHVIHKVPVGDSPYVRAKHVQLVDKDPDKAIVLFWSAINSGDRVDSALKDMAIVMKQQNRPEEAIEAIKSLRSKCSEQAQESLDNVLLDLFKRCGRLDDQINLLKHKLDMIHQGVAFNGKRTKTARSQGKKFQVSIEQEATRLLGNLGWAYMQKANFIAAENVYRKALSIEPDNNKVCNLGICLMKQGRVEEARSMLQSVTQSGDSRWGSESHIKSYERAQEMLRELEASMSQLRTSSGVQGSGNFSRQEIAAHLHSWQIPSMPHGLPGNGNGLEEHSIRGGVSNNKQAEGQQQMNHSNPTSKQQVSSFAAYEATAGFGTAQNPGSPGPARATLPPPGRQEDSANGHMASHMSRQMLSSGSSVPIMYPSLPRGLFSHPPPHMAPNSLGPPFYSRGFGGASAYWEEDYSTPPSDGFSSPEDDSYYPFLRRAPSTIEKIGQLDPYKPPSEEALKWHAEALRVRLEAVACRQQPIATWVGDSGNSRGGAPAPPRPPRGAAVSGDEEGDGKLCRSSGKQTAESEPTAGERQDAKECNNPRIIKAAATSAAQAIPANNGLSRVGSMKDMQAMPHVPPDGGRRMPLMHDRTNEHLPHGPPSRSSSPSISDLNNLINGVSERASGKGSSGAADGKMPPGFHSGAESGARGWMPIRQKNDMVSNTVTTVSSGSTSNSTSSTSMLCQNENVPFLSLGGGISQDLWQAVDIQPTPFGLAPPPGAPGGPSRLTLLAANMTRTRALTPVKGKAAPGSGMWASPLGFSASPDQLDFSSVRSVVGSIMDSEDDSFPTPSLYRKNLSAAWGLQPAAPPGFGIKEGHDGIGGAGRFEHQQRGSAGSSTLAFEMEMTRQRRLRIFQEMTLAGTGG